MTSQSELEWLCRWYAAQCDDEWEHEYGIKIQTLDNPGWRLTVALVGTKLETAPLQETKHNYDDDTSWWICWKKGTTFEAAGGPHELPSMIDFFRRWVTENGE